jgi:hypothetical protein
MDHASPIPSSLPAPRTHLIGVARQRPCTLVACRGCCCGDFQVRATDCLGPCDQANAIVVQPSATGRGAGGRATWVGFAMDDDCTEEIVSWAAAGGPGLAEPGRR